MRENISLTCEIICAWCYKENLDVHIDLKKQEWAILKVPNSFRVFFARKIAFLGWFRKQNNFSQFIAQNVDFLQKSFSTLTTGAPKYWKSCEKFVHLYLHIFNVMVLKFKLKTCISWFSSLKFAIKKQATGTTEFTAQATQLSTRP